MIPTNFEQANKIFGPPSDMEESQVFRIPAYLGEVKDGSCDGAPCVIVAWKPTKEELEDLNNDGCVYLSCLGGLPPHFLVTQFPKEYVGL